MLHTSNEGNKHRDNNQTMAYIKILQLEKNEERKFMERIVMRVVRVSFLKANREQRPSNFLSYLTNVGKVVVATSPCACARFFFFSFPKIEFII